MQDPFCLISLPKGHLHVEKGVTLIEMVKPGGVSESVRMFGITRELCAGLPAAGNLNPIMQFSRWLHMEGVEIAEFHGDLRMKGRK